MLNREGVYNTRNTIFCWWRELAASDHLDGSPLSILWISQFSHFCGLQVLTSSSASYKFTKKKSGLAWSIFKSKKLPSFFGDNFTNCPHENWKVHYFPLEDTWCLVYNPDPRRDWDTDPSTSTIDRVKLQELDFPAITVCPDWATDQLAIQTVYNKWSPLLAEGADFQFFFF